MGKLVNKALSISALALMILIAAELYNLDHMRVPSNVAVAELGGKIRASEATRDELRKRIDAEAPLGDPSATISGVRSELRALSNTDEFASKRTEVSRKYRTRYARLLYNLRLTNEGFDRMVTLLTEKSFVSTAMKGFAGKANIPPADSVAARREVEKQIDNDLNGVLGENGRTVFDEYEAAFGSNLAADKMVARARYSKYPITPSQANAIAGILYKSTNSSAFPVITDATVSEAAQFLDKDQLVVVREIKAERDALNTLNRMRKQFYTRQAMGK